MHIYCKKCKKRTANTFPKEIILISKNKIKGKSRCATFLTKRIFINEIEVDLEIGLKFIFIFLLIDIINIKTYCVKCKKDTDNLDSKIFRTKNNRLIMQSKCSVCKNRKSRFVKEQDAKGLLSNLGIKTPLTKIPLLNVLFQV